MGLLWAATAQVFAYCHLFASGHDFAFPAFGAVTHVRVYPQEGCKSGHSWAIWLQQGLTYSVQVLDDQRL